MTRPTHYLVRMRVFLAAVTAFDLASLACGLAPGPMLLVVARMVQGASAALMFPQALTGIQQLFGQERTNYPVTVSVDDTGTGLTITVQAVAPADPVLVCELLWSAAEGRPSDWIAAVQRAGYAALPANDPLAAEGRRQARRLLLWRWLVGGFCMMQVMMYATPAYVAGPGSLVVFPAGVPHRNWNGGTEPTVHLAFNAPMPDPAEPFARPVG